MDLFPNNTTTATANPSPLIEGSPSPSSLNWVDVANTCQKRIATIKRHVIRGMVDIEHRRERFVFKTLCELGIIVQSMIHSATPTTRSVLGEDEKTTRDKQEERKESSSSNGTAADNANHNDHNQHRMREVTAQHVLKWSPFEIAAALLFVAGKEALELFGSNERQREGKESSATSPLQVTHEQIAKAVAAVEMLKDDEADDNEGNNKDNETAQPPSSLTQQQQQSILLQYVSPTERKICALAFKHLFLPFEDAPTAATTASKFSFSPPPTLLHEAKEANGTSSSSSSMSSPLLFPHLPRLSTYACIGALYPLLISNNDNDEDNTSNSNDKAVEGGDSMDGEKKASQQNGCGDCYDENKSQNTIADNMLRGGDGKGGVASFRQDFSFLVPLIRWGLTNLVRRQHDGVLSLIRVLLFDDRVHNAFTLDAIRHVSSVVTAKGCGGGDEEGFRAIAGQIAVILKSYYNRGEEDEDDNEDDKANRNNSSSSSPSLPRIVKEAASRVQKKTMFRGGANNASSSSSSSAAHLTEETLEERLHMTLVTILEDMMRLAHITPIMTNSTTATAPAMTAMAKPASATTTASAASPPLLSGLALLNKCFLGPVFAALCLRRATTRSDASSLRNDDDNAEEPKTTATVIFSRSVPSVSAAIEADEVAGSLRALWAIAHGSSLKMMRMGGGGGASAPLSASASSSSLSSSRRLICLVWDVVAKGVMHAYAALKSHFSLGDRHNDVEDDVTTPQLIIGCGAKPSSSSSSSMVQGGRRGPLIVELDEKKEEQKKGTHHPSSPPSPRHLHHLLHLIEKTLDTLLVTARTHALSPQAEEILLVLVGNVIEREGEDAERREKLLASLAKLKARQQRQTAGASLATPLATPSLFEWRVVKLIVPTTSIKMDHGNVAADGANNSAANLPSSPHHHHHQHHRPTALVLESVGVGEVVGMLEPSSCATATMMSVGESLVDFLKTLPANGPVLMKEKQQKMENTSRLGVVAGGASSSTAVTLSSSASSSRPNVFIHRLFKAVVEAMVGHHAITAMQRQNQIERRSVGGSSTSSSLSTPSSSSSLSPVSMLGITLLGTFDAGILMNMSSSSALPSATSTNTNAVVGYGRGGRGLEKNIIMMIQFLSLMCAMDEGSVEKRGSGSSNTDDEKNNGGGGLHLMLLIGTALPQLLSTVKDILDTVVIDVPKEKRLEEMKRAMALEFDVREVSGDEEDDDADNEKKNDAKKKSGKERGKKTSSSKSLFDLDATVINHQILCLEELKSKAEELLERYRLASVGAEAGEGGEGTEETNINNNGSASSVSGTIFAAAVIALETFLSQVGTLRGERLPTELIADKEEEEENIEKESEDGEEQTRNGTSENATKKATPKSATAASSSLLSSTTAEGIKSSFLSLSRLVSEGNSALLSRSAASLAVAMRRLLAGVKALGDNYRRLDEWLVAGGVERGLSPSSAITAPTTDASTPSSSVFSSREASAYIRILREIVILSLKCFISIHDGNANLSAAAADDNNNNNALKAMGTATCSTDLFVQTAAIQIIAHMMLMRLDGGGGGGINTTADHHHNFRGGGGRWIAAVIKKGLTMGIIEKEALPPVVASSISSKQLNTTTTTTTIGAASQQQPLRLLPTTTTASSAPIQFNYAPMTTIMSSSSVRASAAPAAAAVIDTSFPIAVPSEKRTGMALLMLEVLTAIMDIEDSGSGSNHTHNNAAALGSTTIKLIDSTSTEACRDDSIGGQKANNNNSVNTVVSQSFGTSTTTMPLFDLLTRIAITNTAVTLNSSTSSSASTPDRRLVVASLQMLGRVVLCLSPRVSLGQLLSFCQDCFRAPLAAATAAVSQTAKRVSGGATTTSSASLSSVDEKKKKEEDGRVKITVMPLMAKAAISASVTYVAIHMLILDKDVGGNTQSTSSSSALLSNASQLKAKQNGEDSIAKAIMTAQAASGGGEGGSGGGGEGCHGMEDLLLLSQFAKSLASYKPFPSLSSLSSSSSSASPTTMMITNTSRFDDPDLHHIDVIQSHGAMILQALEAFKRALSERLESHQGYHHNSGAGGGGGGHSKAIVEGLKSDIEYLRRMELGEESGSSGTEEEATTNAAAKGSSCNRTVRSDGSNASALRVVAQHLLVDARQKARRDLSGLSSFSSDLTSSLKTSAEELSSHQNGILGSAGKPKKKSLIEEM